MTEPLIDRHTLILLLDGALYRQPSGRPAAVDVLADNVLDYLRSVLTPETLWDEAIWYVGGPDMPIGALLHRRIFGEDK